MTRSSSKSKSQSETDPLPKVRELSASWTDIEAVGESAATTLRTIGIPESLIEAALAPGGVPRIETEGDYTLVLLRVFDAEADKRAANAREMTRKIGIFILPSRIITVHRFELPKIPELSRILSDGNIDPTKAITREQAFTLVVNRLIDTYVNALTRGEGLFDTLEESVFLSTGKSFRVREAYFLKRRLNILRKMMQMTGETLEALAQVPHWNPGRKSLLRRRIHRALQSTDFFLEGMNQLLQLHVSLNSQKTNEASQRTNEVMRVLTVFSAFFLPLSFIAGVYGMNFENMPELHHRLGYFGALLFMLLVAAGIWYWFRRRGWLTFK